MRFLAPSPPCITNTHEHEAAPWFDASWAPAEYFRCFSEIILPFLLWGEKPRDRFLRKMGIPPAAGIQPIPVLSGPHGRGAGWPCPTPPESLLAPERGKSSYIKWCQKFRNCSVRETSSSWNFPPRKSRGCSSAFPPPPRQRGLCK